MTFLCDFVLVFLQVRGLPDFAFSQMFTVYYEWLGVFAVIGMALYNGQSGSGHKQLSTGSTRHTFIFSTGHPALSTRLRGKESFMAHILAVDDDHDLCALLKTALERDGHTVETRTSGNKADRYALPLGRLHPAGCDDARRGRLCRLPPHSRRDGRADSVSDGPHR